MMSDVDIATLGFCIYKIWQILNSFAGTLRQAQILEFGGVCSVHFFQAILGTNLVNWQSLSISKLLDCFCCAKLVTV